MERILIIGPCGCGKTTLARKLAETLRLPLVHLDVLYWRDGWQTAPREEFDALLCEELQKPRWVIDGNHGRTIPLRLTYCDTVIYMDYSRGRCVWGCVRRVIQNYGKSRPDMGGDCPERFDRAKFEFLKAVWNFNKKNRRRYYEMLNGASDVRRIILKNPAQTKRFLQEFGQG